MLLQILVVDEPAVQPLMELNLSRAGHQVTCCGDAESAQVRLDETLPDMLVLE